MGIIILGLSAILSVFCIPGFWLASKGISGSESPTNELILLVTSLLAITTVCFIGPFLANSGGTIYKLGIIFDLGYLLGAISLFIGIPAGICSITKQHPKVTVIVAALFLSTALVPVFYFSGKLDILADIFDVTWTY